jgi:outer membrane murein-binding lipoprotein Lpp
MGNEIAASINELLAKIDNLTSKVDTLTSRMHNLTSSVDTLTSRMDNLTSSVDTRFSNFQTELELVPRQVHTFLHDLNRHKVEVMHQSMRSMKICENKITVHYVLWNDKVFGLTVAHTPCFWKDKPPPEIIPCEDMDVSLIKSCPPAHSGLLNLSGSVTVAQLGDEVMSCGFASVGAKRCWFGTVAGKWGNTVKSVHFTSKAFEHEEYILIAGASQDKQMSGSAVLNGYGESVLIHINC